jgi:predicted acetyltransferase
VPELTPPSPEFRVSFAEAMAEFSAEGRGSPEDSSSIGAELRRWSDRWHNPDGFADYVADLRADEREDTPRPAGRVPCTTWWWVDGSTWLGRIALRHRLTPLLLEVGGHIGYDVRPSARRLGHATAMLRAVLPQVAELDIHRALVTCDVNNEASRRVIEANGGQLEDQRVGKLRYWIIVDPTR